VQEIWNTSNAQICLRSALCTNFS